MNGQLDADFALGSAGGAMKLERADRSGGSRETFDIDEIVQR